MFRSLMVTVPLLLVCAAAAADDAADTHKGSQPIALQPSAQRQESAQPPRKDAKEPADAKGQADVKGPTDVKMSGMSVLGNEEAPKSLVIVPWKSSQLGDAPGFSRLLDDSTQPVDKEVFMRELAYYQIRSTSH